MYQCHQLPVATIERDSARRFDIAFDIATAINICGYNVQVSLKVWNMTLLAREM